MERDDGFDDLFRKYSRRLYLYLIEVLKVPMRDVEDLAIETFQRYFEESEEDRNARARRLQFRGDVKWAHLRHIARRVHSKHLKRERRADVSLLGDLPWEPEAPQELETSRLVRKALEKLPEVEQDAIRLRTDGLTLAQIAERLDLPMASVRSHLFRAMKAIREDLGLEEIPAARGPRKSRSRLESEETHGARRRSRPSFDHMKSDPTSSQRGRHLNAWLEDADPPLHLGVDYRLGVDIGVPHRDAVASSLFREPDWGGRDSLPVVLVLTADHARVGPRYRTAELPRIGNMPAIFFTIRPLETRSIRFRLDVVTAREGDVLESVSFVLEVARAQAAAG